ncbi:hypothetical protein J1TS5_04110 [Paenibacillus macerans]|uniref:hypothetical protein n=1 Tax=Paenibacillus macerans TaxID=44252 RepID=UPI001B0DEE8A|nr:hypothetical protein [Paenibacillus macerans]GIP08241.1 hypothetical protein J1TS5_04110 [Paenibacillus macerans]
MRYTLQILLLALTLFLQFFPHAYAEETTSEDHSVVNRLEQQTKDFNSDEFGKQMEQKGNELFEMVRSSSKLYISLALIVFLALLLGGLFFKRLLVAAFSFLALAVIGFLILNYWPQLLEGGMAFLKWLFDKGGEQVESASGL